MILFAAMFSIIFYNSASAKLMTQYSCNIRYEMAEILRKERDCSIFGDLHPMCSRDITASFSDSHPYIFAEKTNGKTEVRGLLPGKPHF